MANRFSLLLAAALLLAAPDPARSASELPPETLLGTVGDREISVEDLDLYIRAKYQSIRGKAPDYPSYESLLRDLALVRVLAASSEAGEPTFEAMPSVRWGRWEVEVNEARARVLERIREGLAEFSESELRSYYEAIRDNLSESGSFSFRTLFLDALSARDEEGRRALRQRAELAVSMLRAKAAPDGAIPLEEFVRIAARETGKPTSEIRVRGPFPLGKINPEIEKAILATEPGRLTGIIETPQGFHIARTEDRKLPRTPSFEEARDKVIEAYRSSEYDRRKRDYEQKNAMEEFMEIHEDGVEALLDKNRPDRLAVPLAGAGDFDVSVRDYEEFCALKSRPTYSPDLEDREEIRESVRSTLKSLLLTPDLLCQAAESEGLTVGPIPEKRRALGMEIVEGSEVFRRAARRRFNRFAPLDPARAREYYNSHKADYKSAPQYRLREIAVAPKPTSAPVDRERELRAADGRALAALAEIQAGSDEGLVVRKYSVGEEAESGGVTDWLLSTSRYPKELWDAVLSRPRGEWMEKPIRFRNKAVLLKVVEEMPSAIRPFEDAEPEVRGFLENERREEMIRNLQDETLRKANFQIREEVLRQLPPIAERFEKG